MVDISPSIRGNSSFYGEFDRATPLLHTQNDNNPSKVFSCKLGETVETYLLLITNF